MRAIKKVLIILIGAVLASSVSIYMYAALSLPNELTLLEGENHIYEFDTPFPFEVSVDREGILKVNGGNIKAAGSTVNFSKPVSMMSEQTGKVNVAVKLFGLVPVKNVQVEIVDTREVVACGSSVGVKLKTEGILVVGVDKVKTPEGRLVVPTKDSGIAPGAVIMAVNGKKTSLVDDLIKEIDQSSGKPLKITYRLNNQQKESTFSPIISADDNKYHIGLWVKDSTAGIGTLTFFDPVSFNFGALGHGITDADSGVLVPIESGELLESSIVGVRTGKSGKPGELKGIFNDDRVLGVIKKNNEFGVYGSLNGNAAVKLGGRLYPVGFRSEIKEGPATVLSNVGKTDIKEYDIVVQRVSRQNLNGSKGMVVKVTDEELLSQTGGIVQGMSGSPIIQNGKIIGAITHVFVNDPTRGYGIFIEAMLRNIVGNNE